MFESESELLVALQAAAKSVNSVLTSGKALSKALEKLDTPKALERQDYVSDALEALKVNDLTIYGCGAQQQDMIKTLDQRLHKMRLNARQALMNGLAQGVDKPDHLKVLSDSPLVIYMHPLTLEVHFEQTKAVWTYAHEPLQTVSLAPDEIIAAHRALVETFRASRIDSLSFWNVCRLCYDMVLLKDGQPSGSRVDIVELLPPLAWLWPNTIKKTTAFPRYLLAYQLQKLRSDKLLQQQNIRLELGTATGGSTRNKANVLFVPMGAFEGQYYLSICFKQA
ncbi:MAG: hypothetical protein IKY83_02240 [Proteobacteria bacterium]|nr:hypothetical protein [Pseudomonadota bacterium]